MHGGNFPGGTDDLVLEGAIFGKRDEKEEHAQHPATAVAISANRRRKFDSRAESARPKGQTSGNFRGRG